MSQSLSTKIFAFSLLPIGKLFGILFARYFVWTILFPFIKNEPLCNVKWVYPLQTGCCCFLFVTSIVAKKFYDDNELDIWVLYSTWITVAALTVIAIFWVWYRGRMARLERIRQSG